MEEVKALLKQRKAIDEDLQRHALNQLRNVAALFCEIHGKDKGILLMGEKLCEVVAGEFMGSSGWANLVAHLRKISG